MNDEEFLRQFEDRSLPFSEWTHRAHIKVAYLYLQHNPYDVALAKLRRGIKAYNAANNVVESDTTGYNETTTCAMTQIVAATMAAYGPFMPTPNADAFCDTHPQLLTKHILRLFYSPQQRVQLNAKTVFIPPDLAPLPRVNESRFNDVDIRLIIDPPQSGPWNMAVDEALLMDAVENGKASLRFYQWSEPTLSLGYFQSYADRDQHAASRNCAVVRRQSGGGAILHDRELTYSLVLPPGHPLARNAPHLYDAVHKAFITALSKTEKRDDPRSTLKCRGNQAVSHSPEHEPFLCFQRQSPGDVILVSPDNATASRGPTRKVLGSAQRRHRGAILQHGSLLLESSTSAPELVGLSDFSGSLPTVRQLISNVCAELTAACNLRLLPYELSPELQSKAAEIANTKYGSPAWTKRR